MPGPPQPPSSDPSVTDLIRQEALKQGVPPELALAVGEQESAFNPTATGQKLPSGEQAIGTFQLLPSTAKRLGINAADPVENIRGGISYLKELLEQHQGDLPRVLGAYGGVKTNTQYVPQVLGRLQKFVQPDPAATPPAVGEPPPAPGVNAQGANPPAPVEGWGDWAFRHGKAALSALDPRQPAGRRNLAGAAGAAGLTALATATAPVSVPLTGLGAVAAGITGAMFGGTAAELGEQVVGSAPPSTRNALVAGGEQGLYEAGGHAALWPVKAVGKRIIAGRVGRYASEGLSAAKTATLSSLQSALDSAQSLLRTTKAGATQANAAAATGTRQLVSQAAGEARKGVAEAVGAGEAQMLSAKDLTAQGVQQAETRAAEGTATARAPYDQLVGAPPPSAARAGRQTNRAIQEGGPARARNLAGQAVEQAAETGPEVDLRPVKAELEAMAERMRPSTVGESGGLPMVAGQNVGQEMTAPERANLRAKLAEAGVSLEESHPLPGVLRQIQDAPDTISFADAHKYKRLLDDAINWQSPAKKQLQGITKGIRIELRDTMTGHAPYDKATAHYAKIAPLYTQGVAPRLRKLATEEPEAVVRLISPKQPTRAQMLVDLLTTQAAEGGDAEGGRRALEAVQAAWVDQKILRGGIEKLGQRIDALPPEFASAFLGDEKAKAVLSNLKTIHLAYQTALQTGEQGVEAAKGAGKVWVEHMGNVGAQRVTEAREAGRQGMEAARGVRAGALAQTRAQGAQRVEQAAQAVPPARQALRTAARDAKGQETALAASSLGPSLQRGGLEHAGADVLRAVLLAPKGSIWGTLSIARLLHGPTARDLIRWAAYSPTGTRAFVKAITSPVPAEALADLARSSGVLGDATNQVTGKPPVQPKGATPIGSPPPAPR